MIVLLLVVLDMIFLDMIVLDLIVLYMIVLDMIFLGMIVLDLIVLDMIVLFTRIKMMKSIHQETPCIGHLIYSWMQKNLRNIVSRGENSFSRIVN